MERRIRFGSENRSGDGCGLDAGDATVLESHSGLVCGDGCRLDAGEIDETKGSRQVVLRYGDTLAAPELACSSPVSSNADAQGEVKAGR